MSVFVEKLLTDHAQEMIKRYSTERYAAQKVWEEVTKNAENSAAATNESSRLLEKITAMKWSQSTWSGTLEAYVRQWHSLMRQYEHLHGEVFKDNGKISLIQVSCGTHPALRAVENTAIQLREANGSTPQTFEQYYQLLINAAQTYDTRTKSTSGVVKKRQVYEALIGAGIDINNASDSDDEVEPGSLIQAFLTQ